MDAIPIMIGLLVNLGVGCIMGSISKAINEKNGYYGGFAWGFWLGVIGIVIVALRQSAPYRSSESIIIPKHGKKLPSYAVSEEDAPNSWRCRCGRNNAQYVSSCVCGMSKHDVLSGVVQSKAEVPADADDEMKNIAALREYKKLLDGGVITQEEFDAKKKAILSE